MTKGDALRALCARFGVAPDYTDIKGVRHEVSQATLRSMLAAMGVDASDDAAARLAQDATELADWQRLLPPVHVFDVRNGAGDLELCLPARHAGGAWRWRLDEESGRSAEGTFTPGDLAVSARRELDAGDGGAGGKKDAGEEWIRVKLPLPEISATGYHRFAIDGASLAAATVLIASPGVCYQPDALANGGRTWGIAAQLYALRSQRNWGMGDFTDLSRLVDFAAREGAGLVGVNPLHALFPHAPARRSPYSPSDRMFLNVFYIDVEATEDWQELDWAGRGHFVSNQAGADNAAFDDAAFQAQLRALRAAETIDYEAVCRLKLEAFEQLYANFREQHLRKESERAGRFHEFCARRGQRLRRYALYCALAEHFAAAAPEAAGWQDWPAEYRHPESPGVAAFEAEHGERVRFFEYLQWQAALQLDAAGRRAFEHHLDIGIYQDLAVSIDGSGAEAWADQEVYAHGVAIGAPPDEFNPNGQNWGLVPWNPVRLRDAAYAPFIATLRRNMRAAGALRIDHVMGLARLFWIDAQGNGAYVRYPMDDLLGVLALESQRNRCMVVGEDLGTVPDEIRDALPAAGIYSSAVMYFEKDADGRFRAPADYRARALVSVSTHDLPTLAGYWYGSDLETRRRLDLYPSGENYEAQVVQRAEDRARLLLALDHEGLQPAAADPAGPAADDGQGELAVAVHRFLARTPAQIMVVQVEDLLGQAEQMNLPGTVDEYPNWRIRSTLDLENWSEHQQAAAMLAALRADRGPAAGRPVLPVPRDRLPPRADAPRATYRLQFSHAFTFDDAVAIVPYLHALGVSHCYASPLLSARPGSTHGYDIVDHTRLNPELGGEEGFERFSGALRAHDMRMLLDIVPNHMGVMGRDNGWWLDVLEHGQASPYAGTFDIDWRPLKDELRGKVLLPVLGDHYGNVLDSGALTVAFDRDAGSFAAEYFEHRFPLDPREYPRLFAHRPNELAARLGRDHASSAEFENLMTGFGNLPPRNDNAPEAREARLRDAAILKRRLAELYAKDADVAHFIDGTLADFNGTDERAGDPLLLHALLEAQAFRLAYWRVAADEINYRRFFDINELAALSMERRHVFDATHRRIFELIAAGQLHGLRIDHPDGLYDPAEYFSRLQQSVASLVKSSIGTDDEGTSDKPFYVVIEKILARDETLPGDWRVHGTTGYEFGDLAGGLFVDGEQCAAMDRCYRQFTGLADDYDTIIRRAKTGIMEKALASELSVLATELARIAEMDTHTRDLTRAGLRDAIESFVACFGVYRTYANEDGISESDRERIEKAIAKARRYANMADGSLFDFLAEVLLLQSGGRSEEYRGRVLAFAMKFQQFTGPVTAKGVEDTAFYRFNRLVSLNEVGGEPECFGSTVSEFHRANQRRRRHWPHSMLAGSTHDAKRSLDLRLRIHALSELADEWAQVLPELSRINAPHKQSVDGEPAPSANDEWLLFQTLVGAWPDEAEVDEGFVQRVQDYMEKAAREAKQQTSWENANEAYEAAMRDYIAAVLDPGNTAFRDVFLPLQRRAARLGFCKSLAFTLLELTSPGVPDIYQGDELLQLALVDPDNRRPVDFAARRAALDRLRDACGTGAPPAGELQAMLEDGGHQSAKLYVTWRCLELRRQHPELFRRGDYQPLETSGPAADRLCAFSRSTGSNRIIVVAPCLTAGLGSDGVALGRAWGDTRIALPAAGDGATLRELFTGRDIPIDNDSVARVADLLQDFPVALLTTL